MKWNMQRKTNEIENCSCHFVPLECLYLEVISTKEVHIKFIWLTANTWNIDIYSEKRNNFCIHGMLDFWIKSFMNTFCHK